MTTALGARPKRPGTYARHSATRRSERRKRTAEKVLAAFILFMAFAVTVLLLGLQWLGTSGTGSAAPSIIHNPVSEVLPS